MIDMLALDTDYTGRRPSKPIRLPAPVNVEQAFAAAQTGMVVCSVAVTTGQFSIRLVPDLPLDDDAVAVVLTASATDQQIAAADLPTLCGGEHSTYAYMRGSAVVLENDCRKRVVICAERFSVRTEPLSTDELKAALRVYQLIYAEECNRGHDLASRLHAARRLLLEERRRLQIRCATQRGDALAASHQKLLDAMLSALEP